MKTELEKENNKRVKKIINERLPQANLTFASVMFIMAWFTLGFWGLYKANILDANGKLEDYALLSYTVIFLIVPFICRSLNGKAKWLKHLLIVLSTSYITVLVIMSGFRVEMLMALPIILSMRYYNKSFTMLALFLCIVGLALITVTNVFFYDVTGIIDLNNVYFDGKISISASKFLFNEIVAAKPDKMLLLKNSVLFDFIPNVIIISLISWVAVAIMKKNLSVLVSVDEYSQREADRKIEMTEMKTRIMISQIKPHFVYNALSSIAVLCKKDPEKASQTTINFTRYLRGNIDSLSSTVPIPFEKELDHTKYYINIEKVRFGDKINVDFNVETTDFYIPALTLQPIVENAIKHGLCKKKEGGTVTVDVKAEKEDFVITVSDNGVGFDSKNTLIDDDGHVGIENVKKRLEALVHGTMTVESTPNVGTKVTLKIPRS